MKKNEPLPSAVIEQFLGFLKQCQHDYQQNASAVWAYDKRNQDYLHEIEFADRYEDRCKAATCIHGQRKDRRQKKDNMMMVEKIAKFAADKQNKPFLDRLNSLLISQKEQENYLTGDRYYNRRGEP